MCNNSSAGEKREVVQSPDQGIINSPQQNARKQQKVTNNSKWFKSLVLLSLIIIFFQGWIWWSDFGWGTNKQNSQSIAAGVKELARLTTAEMHIMTTIEGEDNSFLGVELPVDFPGTKRVFFIVIPAKIIAGVDLQQLTPEDLKVDKKNKTIEILLPKATLLSHSIDLERLKIFTAEGLLRAKTTIQESLNLINQSQVEEKIIAEANKTDILLIAEVNTVKLIQSFYKNLGYDVNVIFK